MDILFRDITCKFFSGELQSDSLQYISFMKFIKTQYEKSSYEEFCKDILVPLFQSFPNLRIVEFMKYSFEYEIGPMNILFLHDTIEQELFEKIKSLINLCFEAISEHENLECVILPNPKNSSRDKFNALVIKQKDDFGHSKYNIFNGYSDNTKYDITTSSGIIISRNLRCCDLMFGGEQMPDRNKLVKIVFNEI